MDLSENDSEDIRELGLIAISKYISAIVGKNVNFRGFNILANCWHTLTILLQIRMYFYFLDSHISTLLLSELFALKDSDHQAFKRWLSVEKVVIFA